MGIDIARNDQFLPGPAGLAGIHGIGTGVLRAHARLSEGRDVWAVLSDQAFGVVDSGQHRGGIWTGKYPSIHPASADRSRLTEGAGDALVIGRAGRRNRHRNDGRSRGEVRICRQDAQIVHSFTPKETGGAMMSSAPILRHSALTTHHSPLTIHASG